MGKNSKRGADKKPRRSRTYDKAMADDLRGRINAGMAVDILNKVVAGELEVTTSRMKACEIALRKALPDLSSMELTGDAASNIVFAWAAIEGKPKSVKAD